MKKTILSALLAVVAFSGAQAQNLSFRAELGANVSNISAKSGSESLSLDPRIGLRAGGAVEIGLANSIYLAPGLTYRMNGTKQTAKNEVGTGTLLLHYLSLPVNLGYRVALSPSTDISLEAGPYLAYALAGKQTRTLDGRSVSEDIEFGQDRSLKRFDAGLGISAAFEYQRLSVRLGTELGLMNILNTKEDSSSMKNSDFYLSVGVRF